MYNPKDIIDLIADNVKKTKSPFGIPKFMANTWWKDISVARDGDALLFTGLMYQFMPYIDKTTHYLEQYEDTEWANYLHYVKYLPKFLPGMGLALMTSGKEKKKSNRILQDIVKILKKSRVDFGYKPELDDYSGIILYDLGDQDGFVQHAEYVAANLKRAGIKKIITVDPHTTYALKELYPKYTGENFEVKTYFELINLSSHNGSCRVTLHDPCFYGRYLKLSDVPQKVLQKLDIECVSVKNSGEFTNCCGGPAESISPKLSKEVLDRRVEELQSTGLPIIAMCPICLGNLRKTGAQVEDLSTLITQCAE
ncbi:MAG: (Fe-S)-binding protein [Desulfobacterales bacterium]